MTENCNKFKARAARLHKEETNKDQFEVQFHVIRTFSSLDIQKTFYFKEFLQAYPSTLNNQQITSIKRYFIQLMEIFEKHKLIESSYQVLVNDKVYHVDKLLVLRNLTSLVN